MRDYSFLFLSYRIFNNPFIAIFRFFLFIIFLIIAIFFQEILLNKLYLFLYSLFFINEVFIHFKINQTMPSQTVKESKDNLVNCMMFSARVYFESSSDGYNLAYSLLKKRSIIFFINKMSSDFKLVKKNIDKKDLLQKAKELVLELEGSYVSEVDLFVAYVLLIESYAKLLEKAELSQNDAINILYWVRNKYLFDKKVSFDLKFHGDGIGEFFVYGWNYEIKKYARDITAEMITRTYAPTVVGRKKEYDSMLSYLAKGKTNNVILVGETGTGKTSLIEHFAYNSYLHTLAQELAGKRVYEVLVERILAGIANQGELESRLDALLTELLHTQNVILFIQNIENIFGGGGYQLDISGVLFDYLKNGKIQIIGTCVPSSYKKYLETKDTVADFFETIRFDEPNKKDALLMVFEKVPEIEHKYKVFLTYRAIEQSVKLSSSYLLDQYLPGKAIDLIEDVAASAHLLKKTIVDKNEVIKKVEEKTRIILSYPTDDEKTVLIHLESEMHKRIVGQDEAVSAVSKALRRLRSGFKNEKRPISVFLFLGPTGVGKTETAKALSSLYFGDEKRMIRLDMSEYQIQDSVKRLFGSLPGEENMRSSFTDEISENPFSLILLDEFEKAHPKILDIFLQMFDEGRLTDNMGKTVSFVNTIIIATSNAEAQYIRENIKKGMGVDSFKKELIDRLQRNEIYKTELLNRFDDIIVFKPLTQDEIKQIAQLLLKNSLKALEEQQIFVGFEDEVIDKIAKDSFNVEYGARNTRRYITNNIENMISNAILEGKIKKNDRLKLVIDEKGEIAVK